MWWKQKEQIDKRRTILAHFLIISFAINKMCWSSHFSIASKYFILCKIDSNGEVLIVFIFVAKEKKKRHRKRNKKNKLKCDQKNDQFILAIILLFVVQDIKIIENDV